MMKFGKPGPDSSLAWTGEPSGKPNFDVLGFEKPLTGSIISGKKIPTGRYILT
jgi:hypothetical protein